MNEAEYQRWLASLTTGVRVVVLLDGYPVRPHSWVIESIGEQWIKFADWDLLFDKETGRPDPSSHIMGAEAKLSLAPLTPALLEQWEREYLARAISTRITSALPLARLRELAELVGLPAPRIE